MTTSAARHPVEAAYPLSPLQRGLLFHSVSSTDLDAYVRQTRYVLKGPLEWDVLGDAWRVTAAAHPPLRTGIFWEGLEAPLQVVAREPALELDLVDLRDAAPGRSGQTLDGLALADRRRGFELSTPPLFRVTLARTAEAEHVLILTFHHILLDGWSMSMLLGDVFVAYAQLMQGVEPALAPRRPFKDYIGWLGRQPLEEAYGYWERRLAGLKELPLFARGGSATSGAADHVELASELDVRQTSAFSLATRRHRITGATLLYASWALALGSVLDVDDLVFGTLVSGRPEDLPGAEDMIGLFLNALPTRVEIDRDASVHSWLQALQQAAVRDRRFGHCSLSEIARRSSLSPGAPLVQSLVVYQNAPDILPPELDEFASYLSVEPLVETEMQGFPLVLACLPGERLRLVLSFDPEELDRATARALLERTAALMTRVAEASGDRLGDLLVAPAVAPPAGSEADRNSTVRLAPSLLEAPPDESPAILEGETRSTYGELRRRAAAVADELRAAGVTAEQSVLVSCARGLDLVAAMFGTWEAGAAYVPVDPGAPGSWRDEVVADCRPSAFVTDAHGAERAAAYGLPVIVVEEAVAAASREPVRIERAGAAAILYQRSATGPLGVVISHQSLAAAVPAWVSAYGLADAERHLMLGGPGDDAHLVEVLGAVGAGALIVVAPAGVERDPPALLDLVETERVGALQLPASVACDLAASGESSAGPLSHVRVTLVGGDDVTGSELERIRGLLHAGARVLRIWSRSETTVDSSVDAGDGRERPLPTSRLAVRDRSGLGVPELHMGTLTIGGTGVARGYLGRPGLTAARFVPDPSGPPGSRAFVTSERVRLLPGATIEHLEAPVQRHRRIRGMRFDLRELEAELENHPGTALAGAMLREGKLHAFVVPSGDRLDLAALRRHLAGRLPAALVPDRLHEVAALPRMRDGRVDSARLAALDPDGEDLGADEPRTEVEWMLARAFADVLGLERVGLQDSFFAAGGDSLLALTLVGRVRAGGVGIELRDVLEWHTVAELARHCGPAAVGAGGPVAPPARQSVALSPSQRRFFADVPRDPAAMDMVEGLEFAERLEPAALEAAVAAAAARHPVLRSRFFLDEGRWRCELARPDDPTAVPALDIADLAHLAPADAERAARGADRGAALDRRPGGRMSLVGAPRPAAGRQPARRGGASPRVRPLLLERAVRRPDPCHPAGARGSGRRADGVVRPLDRAPRGADARARG